MNLDKIVKTIQVNGEVLIKGAAAGITGENITAGATVGIQQGLKYKGDFKRGLIAAGATIGVLALANGLWNVIANQKAINEQIEIELETVDVEVEE